MSTRKGQISVNTKDILPIIKKWLYSEHDIFLRELVSNACDAITKRGEIARMSNKETPQGQVDISIDPKKNTLTISDNGIGMSEQEVEKYIAQLAFSGAQEFANKMKDLGEENSKDEIIGKFGLGFYSAFMVADKVEVDTLSMEDGAKPTKWISEGDEEYEFQESSRDEVGTSITLHINKDSSEFLDLYSTRSVLHRYCDFMPYPISVVDLEAEEKKKEEAKKENKEYEFSKEVINETVPLWKKDPKEISDEDYKEFYRKMYPMDQEPLFWLHLRVDHPFNLQGILYFPKLNPNKPVNENNIKLYCRQVYVSDNVKNIIPEFLGLLKGTIDSVDIPLNVSRSALQGDPNIKKISNYIVKKVAEALKKLSKKEREKYESIWEDIGLFVKYGIISDPKFDELMRPYAIFKNSESKYVTIDEYLASHPETHAEKLKDKMIYFEKHTADVSLRAQLLKENVQTIETDNYIDPHVMQHLEMNKQGDHELKFVAVDTIIEELLADESTDANDVKIKEFFHDTLIPKDDESKLLEIEVKKIKHSTTPAYFKVDEQSKRFQQMTKTMGQSALNIPLKKTLVINPTNSLVQNAMKLNESDSNKALAKKLCEHVKDLATISSEGLDQEKRDDFVVRSQELIGELSSLIVH